jgi:hypothetical protein
MYVFIVHKSAVASMETVQISEVIAGKFNTEYVSLHE